ncbi:DUF4440 domain-containing protein [Legionella londiniensis]|uniref:DUF4440 domain-containing protein n=1 Tax=Legionella londiniensis TaxID=45068 RepID=A0A0W0VP04_9GAMM|nr:DUF4440 domain-containing protein [Legionella londiniensis]KTD21677.1 hypothetical protein Llon_0842 [Legionella londiniensis]STX93488.1 Uncharacterized protein conserved in bacteria [Legionella londiniensis]
MTKNTDNLFAKIIKQEKQLIAKKESVEQLSPLIDDEFIEIAQTGKAFDKREVIRWLEQESHSERTGLQFKARLISDQVILLTYISSSKVEGGNCKLALRSSLWREKEGYWRMVFHQETPID